ncbi:MAG: serine/threonine-protein phosphatase [Chloracidobacterium sp.]|nr:serine/threonine-protein phosphatase [Chloracidobacterium sp.]
MKFEISGITNMGTVRTSNEDRILVNGRLLSEGEVHFVDQDSCRTFVADGVGGNRAGEVAANYVLEKMNLIPDLCEANFEPYLLRINKDFISMTKATVSLAGAATTLTGLMIDANGFLVIHCGDSQLWLFRNEMFFKVTKDQVFDEYQENSPITSFFGGTNDNLKFDKQVFIDGTVVGDVFLICSDGLFKSLNKESVKSIIKGEADSQTKARVLIQNCLVNGAEDNVSLVVIRRID